MAVFNDSLLFIHIPKTAGTAVKFWLLKHLPDAKGQHPEAPETSRDFGYPIGHIPLRQIVDPPAAWVSRWGAVPRPAESFTKILAIVRDPYEQQASQYWFWLQRGREWLGAHGLDESHAREMAVRGKMHPHDYGAVRAAADEGGDAVRGFRLWLTRPRLCDFHIWYEAHYDPNRGRWREDTGIEFDHYRTWLLVGGEIPPNVVIVKMEELATAWQPLLAEFVPNPPPLPVVNSHAAGRPPVDELYTPEAARLVEQKFPWTFETLYERRSF